jgi:hypothetical protein
MAVDAARAAPYAPPANVLAVIRRLRDRGLPEVLTVQELTRLGIPEGNAPRTLQALRFLGLVDEEGRRTPNFDRLARVSVNEYPETLAEIIQRAYEDVFAIVDPAEANDIDLHDAFRHFRPEKQWHRMVVLFSALCREAGLMPGGSPERTRTRRPAGNAERETAHRRSRKPSTSTEDFEEQQTGRDGGEIGRDYSLLVALIRQLPRDGRWTKGHRDKWLQAMEVNLDLLLEVTEGE